MRLFLKKDGETITVLDPHFRHYFYVTSEDPERLASAIEKTEADRRGMAVKPESVEVVERNLLKEPKRVVKVEVDNPMDITPLSKEIRDLPKVNEIYEHDIPPARRYLVDHGLTPMEAVKVEGELQEKDGKKELIATTPPEPAGEIEEDLDIMCFDIETYSPSGDPAAKKDPIIMLSIAGNNGFRKVITWKDFETDLDCVEVVENEKSLLERFVQIVEEQDFDVTMGYNSDLFDFPYLTERADKLDVDMSIGRNGVETKSHRRRFETVTRVPGRPHIDIYAMVDFLSRIGAIRLINYTLENVYEHMIGESKPDLESKEIFSAWEEGGLKGSALLDYSLSDSEGALELGLEIFPLIAELSKTVKQSLFDVSRMTPGQLVEWLLVFKAHEIDELVPARPRGKEFRRRSSRGSYVGGYVKEPKKGLHEDLVVLDFRSLYPTIIVTHNIDPATLDCDCCTSEERVKVPNLDYEFCTNRRGFIPEALEQLIEDRVGLKREMSEFEEGSREYNSIYNQQWALKIIANSFYGMLGYSRARWYSKECAESVTSFGRHYIKNTIDMAEDEGFDVIYADTDSLLSKVGDKSREEVEAFLKKVNEEMPGIMELELEGYYKRGVFITKKRYAMVTEGGKMEVKGLEFVRRDWAALAKRTQEEVLRAVLEDGSPEEAAEIVQKVTKDVKQGKVELEDLIIHTQLKKPIEEYKTEGPHVAAAKRLREAGEEIEPGMTITYIVEKDSGNVGDRAIPVSQFGDRNYDPDYYNNHQILPAVMRVMEVLGYDEEELRYEDTKQMKLGTFGCD